MSSDKNPFKIITLLVARIVFHLKITFHSSHFVIWHFSISRRQWLVPFCLHWNQSHRNGDRYKLSLLIINALCSDQARIIFNKIKCEQNIESFFLSRLICCCYRRCHCRCVKVEMTWIGWTSLLCVSCLLLDESFRYFCLASGWLLLKYTQCPLHFKWELTAIISLNDASDGKICSWCRNAESGCRLRDEGWRRITIAYALVLLCAARTSMRLTGCRNHISNPNSSREN